MSVWNASQRMHMDVGDCVEEKCHIRSPEGQIITAMCMALETVWIGPANGHIMVFGMNPPGEMLIYFRPYSSSIYIFFLPVNGLGLVKRKSA